MSLIPFVVATLAVWRVTHLLVAEDGPWDLLVRVRAAAQRIGLGRLINCFYCCSVWVAVPAALLLSRDWRVLVLTIPALSGGAILLDRATGGSTAAAAWVESKEEDDVLLRR